MKPTSTPDMFDSQDDFGAILAGIVRLPATNEHFKAIQATCRITLDLYRSSLLLVKEQQGFAAEVLVRSIFETTISGIILAKHPEDTEKFRRHGKFAHLRSLHFAKSDVSEEAGKRRVAMHEKYRAEIASLYKEFGDKPWHGLSTAESIEAAGLDGSLHGRITALLRREHMVSHTRWCACVPMGILSLWYIEQNGQR